MASLATRVSDLATAVATAIKADRTRLTALDSHTRLTVYVTADWATDTNNPLNGGTLPANTPVYQT